MSEVTRVLEAAERGDRKAAAELLPLIYDELRKLAAALLAREAPGQTLQVTALVHEAYVRVAGPAPRQDWGGRDHFFAAAAEAMRRILVDNARAKKRVKRGGGWQRVRLIDVPASSDTPAEDLLALDAALDALAREDAAKAGLVKMRYFAGLTLEEAAACQGISLATAKRRWAVARAWLYRAITADAKNSADS